ncbi:MULTISPECIES: phosphonate ABC transporter ATP-binding protein [Photobacterium]|uniref:Phosphonate ABC transporter ATP-binding protein n=1 Tax=Photobacterium ganghwense TaxID=320778 RepID=A0A0J1K0N9_9GAMM|nr:MULTISPECIES: phosphonate ABC transporter ATP-binding protein [Photobacterium]KLV08027.1 phosphonate ABC transporter ATP-binding protein [Photobacterium ganghwense]PSU07144.1 phosphonate ABC transporter ATP-binding protein [Photobacterium ganghwense]
MLVIKDLQKSYGDNQVLKGVDLTINEGEFVVILGPSGAGKSTLLRCINRLTEATNGDIFLNGKNIAHVQGKELIYLRRNVGMIFQHHNLTKRLSVLKNVLVGRMSELPFWSCALQLFPQSDITIAHECLEQVGLADKVNQRADSLSGGQQQRVGIARALAQQPQLMLADEPVASLDPKSSRKVLSYIRNSCKQRKIAVLCNLHQIDYAMEFAERIVGLSNGKVIFDGLPESLTPEVVSQIYSGLEDDSISQLVTRMASERRATRLSEMRVA